jgi:hypothetical protein
VKHVRTAGEPQVDSADVENAHAVRR